jgi:mannose-6-phosphate isomerase-like protein (cupin superfamily)
MKVNDSLNGTVVKNNETYIVVDNTYLKRLVVSKTILHPGKETGGHKHIDQEEVYQFIHGSGRMQIDNNYFSVSSDDVVLIEDGVFHKVYNDSAVDDLVFICVFDGKRKH